MKTNAVGTVNVNEAFYRTARRVGHRQRGVHGAYPPTGVHADGTVPLALQDRDRFMAEMLTVCARRPKRRAPELAYAVSKGFVRWYSSSQAERFNTRGLRIVSISPGSRRHRDGPARRERRRGRHGRRRRRPALGHAREMADLLAFCVSDKAGYLTGTDILNDGGVVASMRERARVAAEKG